MTAKTEPKKPTPAHFLLRVRGEAMITAGINPKTEMYDVTVRCPQLGEGKSDTHYLTYALSDRNGERLKKAIAKKYGGCEIIRTHEVMSRVFVTEKGETKDVPKETNFTSSETYGLDQMRYSELVAHVRDSKLPVKHELYTDASELREAIQECETDKEKFLENQKKKEHAARIAREALLLDELDTDDLIESSDI